MASKSKQTKAIQGKKDQRLGYWIIVIPVIAFLIKLIVMGNTPGGGWLGADGENYLKGVDAIIKDGLASKEPVLGYWPAGYPIFIWLLTKLSVTHVFWLLSFIQSSFYAFASYYFTRQLRDTKVKPYLFWISLILAANPTLSLSSLAVGYESPIAACMLMVVGLIIKSHLNSANRKLWLRVAAVGGWFALASFMQPRWVLTTFVVAIVWAFANKNRKNQALILIGVMAIMAIAPGILILRNQAAANGPVVSTNINAALAYGTGDTTSGGYGRSGDYIECGNTPINEVTVSSEVMKCAAVWYVTHPLRTIQLSWNKTVYFWSPWLGPSANGTMARNPWLKVHPFVNIAKQSQQGHDLIYGAFGKLISWLFIGLSIAFLIIGFWSLYKNQGIERILGLALFVIVVTAWIAAVATLGDHRFRIPIMSASLPLQVVGVLEALKYKNKKK